MRLPIAFLLFMTSAVMASPAAAQVAAPQSPDPQTPGATRRGPTIVLGGFGLFEFHSMAAKDTFDAVFGSSRMSGGGAGAEVQFGNPFVRIAFAKASEVGSRVFFHDGAPLANNIPLTLKLNSIEIAGGWRFPLGRRRRTAAYGGAGLLRVGYDESSQFAGPGENIRDSFTGYTAFGGFDVVVWKWVYAGFEAQYRAVPDALGDGGVSKELGETDLGGVTARVLFGVRK